MKTTAKFIVLHPSIHKTTSSASHLSWLALFFLIFLFTFAFTLFTTKDSPSPSLLHSSHTSPLPQPIADALLHYATDNSTSTSPRMSPPDIRSIASVLRSCTAPCNLLVFGLTHETLLWHALNHRRGGRTVFVGDNSYQISKIEERHPSIEAYDVVFTTKVRQLNQLLDHCRREIAGECRPVQNLLFSDCKLAINDLPNHVYDIPWDVIVVDGPRGYAAESPGRMAAIFTAAVMARSKRENAGGRGTHVFVHEIERQVEKVCSEEFLCRENLVEITDSMGHFLVAKKMEGENNWGNGMGFCSNFHSSEEGS